jgi:hypothetical protein
MELTLDALTRAMQDVEAARTRLRLARLVLSDRLATYQTKPTDNQRLLAERHSELSGIVDVLLT